MRPALLLATLLGAGCFSPHFTNDRILCSDDAGCPGGYACTRVGTCFVRAQAPRRCPAFALFCDDFEGHALASWGAAMIPPTGDGFVAPPSSASVVVDEQKPLPSAEPATFASLRSLHVVAPGTSQQPNASIYALFWPYRLATPVTAPATLAVRAYVYAPRPLQEQPYFLYVHDSSNGNGLNVGAHGGDASHPASWTVYDRGAQRYVVDNASATISVAAWHCVELVASVSNVFGVTSDSFELFVDGQSVGQGTIDDATTSARLDEVDLGNSWAQSSQANEYFLDDVVIANQRIGCE